MKVFFLIFVCQVTFAQQQGITIPFTTLSCKAAPTDSKPLTISFAPLEKTHSLDATSGDRVNNPKVCSAILDAAQKITRSGMENEATYISKIQKLNPNIAISSHMSKLPDIKLSNLGSNNIEFISKDEGSLLTHNFPVIVPNLVTKDSFPTKDNIVNTKPSTEPIFLQTLPAVNIVGKDLNVVYCNFNEKQNCYKNPEVITSPESVSGSKKRAVAMQDSVKIEDHLVPGNKPCKLSIKPCKNTATSSVTDNPSMDKKVLYPLSNITFCLGTDIESDNRINEFLKTNTGNILALFLDKKSDNGKCKSHSESLPTMTSACKLNSPTPANANHRNCADNDNSIHSKTPLSTSQCLPITLNTPYSAEPQCNLGTKYSSPNTKPAVQNPSVVSITDPYTNYLSSSLNTVISVLTTNILSAILENNCKVKSKEEICSSMCSPKETFESNRCNANKDISSLNKHLTASLIPHKKSECTSIPPCLECPVTLPSPKVDLLNKDLIQNTNSNIKVPCDVIDKICTASAPVPYLASITINVIPSNEAPNNYVILI